MLNINPTTHKVVTICCAHRLRRGLLLWMWLAFAAPMVAQVTETPEEIAEGDATIRSERMAPVVSVG